MHAPSPWVCSIKFYEKTRGPKIARRRRGDRHARNESAASPFLGIFERSSARETILPVVGIVRCLDRIRNALGMYRSIVVISSDIKFPSYNFFFTTI